MVIGSKQSSSFKLSFIVRVREIIDYALKTPHFNYSTLMTITSGFRSEFRTQSRELFVLCSLYHKLLPNRSLQGQNNKICIAHFSGPSTLKGVQDPI